ncbi:hypothetical protein CRE_02434 [Caenorhabditis remanei]|uniref:Uncharacterized protein n=1 Tax=Caenorhabditis remanei TaxID=31234 RepID=E3MIR4_CAERE|nr:hypothetical protein CRE_02434 [Caenorhabditis remanei]
MDKIRVNVPPLSTLGQLPLVGPSPTAESILPSALINQIYRGYTTVGNQGTNFERQLQSQRYSQLLLQQQRQYPLLQIQHVQEMLSRNPGILSTIHGMIQHQFLVAQQQAAQQAQQQQQNLPFYRFVVGQLDSLRTWIDRQMDVYRARFYGEGMRDEELHFETGDRHGFENEEADRNEFNEFWVNNPFPDVRASPMRDNSTPEFAADDAVEDMEV